MFYPISAVQTPAVTRRQPKAARFLRWSSVFLTGIIGMLGAVETATAAKIDCDGDGLPGVMTVTVTLPSIGERCFDEPFEQFVDSLDPDDDGQGRYSSETCRSSGWDIMYVEDNSDARNIAEVCEIRTYSDGDETLEEGFRQGCTVSREGEFANVNYPLCSEIFGDTPFPSVPAGFNEAYSFHRFNSDGELIHVLPSPSASTGETAKVMAVGAAAMVGFVVFMHGGGAESFHFSPRAEIRHDDGLNHYVYGSRMDYAADDLTGYWSAAQTRTDGTNGDWVYGSGAAWTGDVFAASFDNSARGLTSDTTMALSAQKQFGVWKVNSSYSAELTTNESSAEWTNRLNIGANAVYDRWMLSPNAELAWQNDVNDKTARLRFDLSREL